GVRLSPGQAAGTCRGARCLRQRATRQVGERGSPGRAFAGMILEDALTQRFLGRLAHDLRGPLAPLQTATYLLRTGELDDARREELHQLLDRQSRRLGGMIDELDDWLRASQGRLLGTTTRTEPVALLEVAMTAA